MNIVRGLAARRMIDAARRALDEGRLEDAEGGFLRVLELRGDTPEMWFNVGLVRKLRRDWVGSVEANRRSAELYPAQQEAFYNMGVAATAIRDWPSAKWAWRGLGFESGSDPGPPAMDFGLGPVRLTTAGEGAGEVVWGRRIDPCRMRLASVPTPESKHRWADVVLHDVVPNGERQVGGQVFPVFDEIERMDPSPHATHEAQVVAPREADAEALLATVLANELGAEDWTSSIRMICAQCSVAPAHAHDHDHDRMPAPSWEPTRKFGLAGPPDELAALLSTWAADGMGRSAGPMRPVEDGGTIVH